MTVKHQYSSVINSISNHSAYMWTPAQTTYSTDTLSTPSDLVSLAWLQKGDIIQIAPLDGEEEHTSNSFATSSASFNPSVSDDGHPDLPPINEDVRSFPSSQLPPSKLTLNVNFPDVPPRPSSTNSEIYSPHCPTDQPQLPNYTSLSGQGLVKPNYSYTHLIFMAIESTPQKCMTVNQIYNWCESNFPFYKHAGGGWKNSLRHNLSINKSFKRLPRDSRREPCDYVKSRSPNASCSSDLEHDELEDDEGPGRGAFWTVEPRERTNLLDAIKRNPWNFNSLASLVSSAQGGDMNGPVLFNTPYLLASSMRKFSLTNSAPCSILRNSLGEPLSHDELLQRLDTDSSIATFSGPDSVESILNLTPGTIHFMSTADGRLIATCGGTADASDMAHSNADGDADTIPLSMAGNYEGILAPKSTALPDSRYWLSPESSKPGRVSAASDIVWSSEEQEKYLQTLDSLQQCESLGSSCNGQTNCDAAKTSADGSTTDDAKHVTKQRRKSRLLPTRVSKCNECKENATSGCESCHTINFSVPSSETETLLTEIINTLDSDQEHGPAGGPLTKRSVVKSTSSPSRTADLVAGLDPRDYKCALSMVKSEDHRSGSVTETKVQSNMELDDLKAGVVEEEVYVTPSPFLDHEYAHCQAQLRVPSENQLVNRYNEIYCSEALNQLAKTRPFLEHSSASGIRLRGRNVEVHTREDEEAYMEYMDTNEDDLSETNDDDDDDGFNQADEGEQGSNTEMEEEDDWAARPGANEYTALVDVAHSKSQQRRAKGTTVYQPRRSGVTRKRGRGQAVINHFSHPLDERVLSTGKRGRRGRRWSHSKITKRSVDNDIKHFVTRRSKRVVRAPRRLYDDFEDSLSIEPYNRTNEMSVEELYQNKQIETHSNVKKVRRMKDRPTSGRRGRQRGRYRGVHRRLYSPSTNGRDNLNELDCIDLPEQPDIYSESDEEMEYLRLAASRQQQSGVLFPSDSDVNSLKSGLFSLYDYGHREDHLVAGSRGRPKTVVGSVGIGAMWGQSRLTMARKLTTSDRRNGKEESLRVSAIDSSENRTTDCHGTSEQTTVEAAQLLFGISQMQNFRRQSGYISLDSSHTSGNLSYDSLEEVSTPHKPSNGLVDSTKCSEPTSPVTSSPVALANT